MLMQEFINYTIQAWDLVEKSDKRSPLRYGQALWQILPQDVLDKLVWGETDFFYYSNDRYMDINMICYRLCSDWVEPEARLTTEFSEENNG